MPRIEVFADITCPFAHVGLRRLASARDALARTDVAIMIRAWPLELINGAALSGPSVAAKIGALQEHAAGDLFANFDATHFPATSLPALALTAAAYSVGDGVGEAVGLAVRDALFEQGRNVALPDVLAEIADAHGVPWSDDGTADFANEPSILADWHDGVARGVRGSPHYFCATTSFFCPTLLISHVHEDLDIRPDEPRFQAFLNTCLG